MPRVCLNSGISVQYEYVNNGGPSLVLLHGYGSSLEEFGPVIPALKDRFTLLRLDFRGHGRSDKPSLSNYEETKSLYRLDDLVGDVVQLIRKIRFPTPAHVLGHCLGGCVALLIALRYPHIVNRLVLCNAAPDFGSLSMKKLLAGYKRGQISTSREEFGRAYFSPQVVLERPELVERYVAWFTSCLRDGLLALLENMIGSFDVKSRLAEVTHPALILSAQQDHIVYPEAQVGLGDKLPNAKSVVIPGAGHKLPLECPAVLARELVQFLGKPPRLNPGHDSSVAYLPELL